MFDAYSASPILTISVAALAASPGGYYSQPVGGAIRVMLPDRIGRYQIVSELGRGGMATVYRAHDPAFRRDVAVKVLPHALLHDPRFRARFEREARLIAGLEHSAIVPVYDYGEEGSQPFIVMRLMNGGSLADRLAHGRLSLPETARILSALAPALDRAHARGIIHRDLKPGNILFDDDDNPYLSDFGIARLIESSTSMTAAGLLGTPAYMSPEQASGERDLDSRSDLYALGVIVFEMLTGQLPFEADTPIGLAMKHITAPVPHISAITPDLPMGTDAVIAQALAKDRAERYSTARNMLTAVSRLTPELAIKEPPPAVSAVPADAPLPSRASEPPSPPADPPVAALTSPAQTVHHLVPTVQPATSPISPARPRSVAHWWPMGAGAIILVLGLAALAARGFGGGNQTPTPTVTATSAQMTATSAGSGAPLAVSPTGRTPLATVTATKAATATRPALSATATHLTATPTEQGPTATRTKPAASRTPAFTATLPATATPAAPSATTTAPSGSDPATVPPPATTQPPTVVTPPTTVPPPTTEVPQVPTTPSPP